MGSRMERITTETKSLENEQVFADVVRVVDGDVGRSSCSGWSQLQSWIVCVRNVPTARLILTVMDVQSVQTVLQDLRLVADSVSLERTRASVGTGVVKDAESAEARMGLV